MFEVTLSRTTLRFLAWATRFRGDATLAYFIGFGAFLLALLLRFLVDPYLGIGFPFLTFFPAIVITAFLCGRGPGILCSALSILAAWYWFIEPRGAFGMGGRTMLAVSFFVLISVVDIFIIDLLTRVLDQLEQSQERTQALLAQRTTLFQELQHRVANNLQMVGSVLAVQERQLRHNPEATQALSEARRRFDMFSRIHRKLHDPAMADQPFAERLRELCGDILLATQAGQVACVVQADDVVFDIDRTTVVSMIILEVVTNALKHAFVAGEPGLIEVRLQRAGPREVMLEITDNGRGMPADFEPLAGDRLGTKILAGFAASLRGTVQYGRNPQGAGTSVRVLFPHAPGGTAEGHGASPLV